MPVLETAGTVTRKINYTPMIGALSIYITVEKKVNGQAVSKLIKIGLFYSCPLNKKQSPPISQANQRKCAYGKFLR